MSSDETKAKAAEAKRLAAEAAAEKPPKGAGPVERAVYGEIAEEADHTYSALADREKKERDQQ